MPMRRNSIIAWTALLAFAAGWYVSILTRDDVPEAPAPTPVVVNELGESQAASEAPPLLQTMGGAPIPQLVAGDSVGVLLERRFGQRSSADAANDYYLYLPPGLDSSNQRWPVILYLHGRSLSGSDLTMLRRYGLPRYLADGLSLPFIVIAPQVPEGQRWTDVDHLATLLDEVLDRYPVDRDRVYLTGYSMGGGGVWRMALEHGDLFAAAAPMAATTPAPSESYERAVADLPMRVFHGTADELAPIADARTMVSALRRSGADVELEAIDGADHGALTRIYGESDLYDWFLAHRRSRAR